MKTKLILPISIVFCTLFSSTLFSETISIASFNTLHLGKSSKNYKEVARILHPYDIIALQEVMDKSGAIKLIKELQKIDGQEWYCKISERNAGKGGKKSYNEFYAFIWKPSKIKFVKSYGFYPEKNSDDFIREPYAAEFKGKNFDFTLIDCHILYGKNEHERSSELAKLYDVYSYFQKLNGPENDVIFAGDFNMSAGNPYFKTFYSQSDKIAYALTPKFKTTVGINKLANGYDNFFFCPRYTNEIINSGVEQSHLSLFDYKYIRKNISDHLPVFITCSDTNDDD